MLQLATAVGLFLGACAVMYLSLHVSALLTLLLAIPAGALLVRVFIIQHDCGHGSFFRSPRANNVAGTLCSVLTLTPYLNWRRQHAGHHRSWNNLDRRQSGTDFYSTCLTVEEYLALSPWRRFLYRLPRHLLMAHVVIPPLVFLVLYRLPFDTPKAWVRERWSVHGTNIALAFVFALLVLAFGLRAVVLVQLPVMIVASIIGVWLFAVQHRFEHARWYRQREWSFTSAALQGSSYLKLPKILQWLTGNIGFHPVHHLAPRIPNYRLEACYRGTAALQAEPPLKLGQALRSVTLALWDEERQKLVRFNDIRRQNPARLEAPA
jgi:omega-6 fatty acid desaturase (delta-12 desaturase)